MLLQVLLEVVLCIEAKHSQKKTAHRLWNGMRPVFWLAVIAAGTAVWLSTRG